MSFDHETGDNIFAESRDNFEVIQSQDFREVLTEPFPKPPHPTIAEIMALVRDYRRAVITSMQWDDDQAGNIQEAINRHEEIFTNIGLAVNAIVRDRDRLEQKILRLSQSQCDAAERRYAEAIARMAGEWNKP
jgi:predicted metal-binding protein